MREYECLYILSPRLSDEEIETATAKLNQVITDNEGEVISTNPWGKRRLAYEIKHVREGFYVQVRYNGETKTNVELDQALRFSESVLRHLIVRADELDPNQSNTIPEQMPELSFDRETRVSRGGRERGPRAETAEESEGEEAVVEYEGEVGDETPESAALTTEESEAPAEENESSAPAAAEETAAVEETPAPVEEPAAEEPAREEAPAVESEEKPEE